MHTLFRNVKLVFLFAGVIISTVVFSADPQPGIKFIQNKNQWSANIHFSAKIPGGTMTIGQGKFQYYFLDNQKIQELHENSHSAEPDVSNDSNIRGHSVQANFIGSNFSQALPFGQSTEYYNYYLGNDPNCWASKAYAYDGMLYPSFYQNIDLKIYSLGQNLKYDFIIAPYGDPSQIVVQYEGADFIDLDNGNLFLKTSLAEIIEKRPFAYQYSDGKKTIIDCEYFLNGNLLSFCFPNGYDPCYELVIDPLLIFSTFSGSTADNWGSTATPGEGGTLYSAGVTNQQTFGGKYPVTPGVFQMNYGGDYDVGILKYDSTGSKLLYATFLGGTSAESPHSLVMNSSEELIVLGTSSSSNFPTTIGAFDRTYNGGADVEHVIQYPLGSDIFIARLNKDGTKLLASTYLGGSANDGLNPDNNGLVKNYGDQLRGDVIADAVGNIFISSVTASTNFPMVNSIDATYQGGSTDAILLKLNPDFSQILWSTYIGGSGSDASHTVKLDSEGNIFVAGGTTSSNFPVTPGCYQPALGGDADGWIAKIAADGSSILHATFTGKTAFDQIYFLDLDQNDEPYVYGTTNNVADNFPVTTNVYSNPRGGQFIQKFDSTLSTLRFSTVFGSGRGTPDLSPTAFLVNECNNIFLAGWGGGSLNSRVLGFETSTFGLRVSEDAIQKSTSGHDFYFMVLTDNAEKFLYGTFLGGSQTLVHVDGGTSRFDKHGIVYHAVCAGCNTDGLGPKSDFPTTSKAWSKTNKSGNCNNAAFKFDLSSLKAGIQTNSVALNMPGLNVVCIPDKIVFENVSIGGEIYKWDLGDGTKITEIDPIAISHEYKNEGQYLVKLKIIDQGTCREVDSTSTIVTVNKTSIEVQDDDALCSGNSYQLKASGGVFYEWRTEDGTLISNASNPTVSPSDTTQYFVNVHEANGCVRQDTVQLNVVPAIVPEFEFMREADCSDRPFIRVKDLTDSLNADDRLFFEFGDGITSDLPEEDHHYENDGVYNLKAVGIREFCVFEKIETIPVFKIKLPNIITPGGSEGLNDNFTIQFGDSEGTTPADYGYKVSLIIYNRWGSIVYQTSNYDYTWSGEGLAAGIYYYEVTVEDHATCKSWLQIMK